MPRARSEALPLFPLASFDPISFQDANRLLATWQHRMGPLDHAMREGYAHALMHYGQPIDLVTTSCLITPRLGHGRKLNQDFDLRGLTRENTCELSRLCAARPGLCRIVLRLWRELVFPQLPYDHAISYQDADLHHGHTYRFDGWRRIGYSSSGTDPRSGRKGRRKWIWGWQCDHLPALTGNHPKPKTPEVLTP